MDPLAAGALVTAIVLPALTWLMTDARSKGRAEVQAEKSRERDDKIAALERTVAVLDKQSAVDHQTVNSFSERLDELRTDIDRRFDRLENILNKGRA